MKVYIVVTEYNDGSKWVEINNREQIIADKKEAEKLLEITKARAKIGDFLHLVDVKEVTLKEIEI